MAKKKQENIGKTKREQARAKRQREYEETTEREVKKVCKTKCIIFARFV